MGSMAGSKGGISIETRKRLIAIRKQKKISPGRREVEDSAKKKLNEE